MSTLLYETRERGWCKNDCVKSEEGCIWVLEMNNEPSTWKGDTPVRANQALVIEPAASWQRLQDSKECFFEDRQEAEPRSFVPE
jgi:hypothetical protein